MKLIRLYRNFLAMLIRYYRWRNDPKNWEIVAYMDMINFRNRII